MGKRIALGVANPPQKLMMRAVETDEPPSRPDVEESLALRCQT